MVATGYEAATTAMRGLQTHAILDQAAASYAAAVAVLDQPASTPPAPHESASDFYVSLESWLDLDETQPFVYDDSGAPHANVPKPVKLYSAGAPWNPSALVTKARVLESVPSARPLCCLLTHDLARLARFKGLPRAPWESSPAATAEPAVGPTMFDVSAGLSSPAPWASQRLEEVAEEPPTRADMYVRAIWALSNMHQPRMAAPHGQPAADSGEYALDQSSRAANDWLVSMESEADPAESGPQQPELEPEPEAVETEAGAAAETPEVTAVAKAPEEPELAAVEREARAVAEAMEAKPAAEKMEEVEPETEAVKTEALAALSPTPGELARLGQRSTSGRMVAPLPPGMILHPPVPSLPHAPGLTPVAEVSPQQRAAGEATEPQPAAEVAEGPEPEPEAVKTEARAMAEAVDALVPTALSHPDEWLLFCQLDRDANGWLERDKLETSFQHMEEVVANELILRLTTDETGRVDFASFVVGWVNVMLDRRRRGEHV